MTSAVVQSVAGLVNHVNRVVDLVFEPRHQMRGLELPGTPMPSNARSRPP